MAHINVLFRTELGWTAEEYGKIGVEFAYFRSRPETDWYPHYIHNQENLIRFGGLLPPIHVNADYRRTRMPGLTHVPYEGGCLMVRASSAAIISGESTL